MAEDISEELFRKEMLDFKERMLRFVEVADHKFDGLSSDIRTATVRLDKIEYRFDHIEERFDRLETKVDQIVSKVVRHEELLDSNESRIAVLEGESH